jgi:phosphoglycolate phosphatase
MRHKESGNKTNHWVIFDMDGTLWNTLDVIVGCWNYAFTKFEKTRGKSITQAELVPHMGKTMTRFAADMLPELTEEEAVAIMELCTEEENTRLTDQGAILYDGVEKTFRTLAAKGCRIGIVSNCQSGYIEAFLGYYDLGKYFDDIECYGNNLKSKGDNIALIAGRNSLDTAWYVGDIQGDYDSAMQAGTGFIHAAYGFGKVNSCDGVLDDIRKLPELVKGLI